VDGEIMDLQQVGVGYGAVEPRAKLAFEQEALLSAVLQGTAHAWCVAAQDLDRAPRPQIDVCHEVNIAKRALTDQAFNAIFVEQNIVAFAVYIGFPKNPGCAAFIEIIITALSQ
jgi:hypothetical protein